MEAISDEVISSFESAMDGFAELKLDSPMLSLRKMFENDRTSGANMCVRLNTIWALANPHLTPMQLIDIISPVPIFRWDQQSSIRLREDCRKCWSVPG